MSPTVHRYADRQRALMAENGLLYPLWYLVVGDVFGLAAVIGAVLLRNGLSPPSWPLLVGLLAEAPDAWIYLFGPLPSKWFSLGTILAIHSAVLFTATSLFLLRPASSGPDTAPLIMCVGVASAAATLRPRVSVPLAAVASVIVAVAALSGTLANWPVYLIAVGVTWMMGFMVQTQMRLLQQERIARAAAARQAASDERQRIAREVHDIAGHSLAITLLHLTGARRALEQDRDIDDAVLALGDAERIGRQAMSDIRRTVGLLNSGSSSTTAEPGIADIEGLVADFLSAGQRVKLSVQGDVEIPSPAVGLNLYRITQESLTNVVKHAPAATAAIELRITDVGLVLSITNELTGVVVREPGTGSGVAGMRQRAEALGGTLSVGPCDGRWLVRAEIPAESRVS